MTGRDGKSSWGRRLWIGGVGCLSLLLLFAVIAGAGLAGSWWSISRRGEPAAEEARRTVTLPAVPEDRAGTEDRAAPAAAATRLEIDLRGGIFQVRPGPPGSDIRVEGSYAGNYYELTEDRRPLGETGSEVRIRFRPTASILTRLLAGLQMFNRDHPNRLTVFIPRDHPVALTLRIAEGQSDTELGGLMLTALDLDVSQGEHRVGFDEPVIGEIERVSLAASMGEIRINGLGNVRFRELDAVSGMGACRIDLGGAWERGTTRVAHLSHRMGELQVLIPEGVRVTDASSTRAILGGTSRVGRRDVPEDPQAPALELDASTTMGGLTVRYR